MNFDVLFLWAMSLLLPVIAVIAGVILQKCPPKKISGTVGYRTRRSRQSQEAWDTAQRLFGRYFVLYGVILCVAVPLIIFGIEGVVDPYILLLLITFAELILMAFPIFAVEHQLKIRFAE